MDNTIVNLLTQIDEIVDHLVNVLPASKEQVFIINIKKFIFK